MMYVGGFPDKLVEMDRVKALYRLIIEINASVRHFENKVLSVDDNGLSSRATFQVFMPGKVALHFGAPVGAGEMDEIFIQTTDRITI